jgi:hypothetical protein
MEDAKFYANLTKNPELGLTARQIKAAREGKGLSMKLIIDSIEEQVKN